MSDQPGLPRSVLVITAEPDARPSTVALELVVDELRRRGVTCTVWFLRARDHQTPWESSRVVDSLRTWAGTHLLEAARLSLPAGWLRGLRLRTWFADARPDVVLLDEGMGIRLCGRLGPEVVRAVRVGDDPAPDEFVEPRAQDADVLVATPDTTAPLPDARHTMRSPLPKDRRAGREMRDAAARAKALREAGAARAAERSDEPLVVGWGDDAWTDGADLFVRGLWTLAERTGHRPRAIWFGLGHDELERERLLVEARRCGLDEDRFSIVPDASSPARLAGDVTFLPARAELDPDEVDLVLVAGSQVVTFEAGGIDHPDVHVVDDLDLEAAAPALVTALEAGRHPGRRSERDVEVWTDRFLALVASCRQ